MYLHGRASTLGAMGCQIDPSWWIYLAISHSSHGMYNPSYKRPLAASLKE